MHFILQLISNSLIIIFILITGIDAPRRDKNGDPLPSSRLVSLELFADRDRPSHVHTTLYVTFGQFLDHDMTRTAVTKLSMQPLGKVGPSMFYHRY